MQSHYTPHNNQHSRVSIPFSSGCALQSGNFYTRALPGRISFQFPFRRDVLCNPEPCRSTTISSFRFQFPFRRDVLCNIAPGGIEVGGTGGFNSLFVGMCFAIKGRHVDGIALFQFQFPFRRDVLCNVMAATNMAGGLDVSIPFSSGCALQSSQGSLSPPLLRLFQFPFRRDVLCNVHTRLELRKVLSFQFPFRRDVLCNP